jgi:hypothetical protein
MFGYVDTEFLFLMPVNFEAAPVNRNDIDVICNCFVNRISTTFIGRVGILYIYMYFERERERERFMTKCRTE